MEKTALIVTGGKAPSKELLFNYIEISDMIIGADKGGESLMDDNIDTLALVGDLDSIDSDVLKWFNEKNINIIESKRDKDETDTMLAIDYAIKKGAEKIYILGGLGQRLDHQIANLALLLYSEKKGIKAYLIDEQNTAFLAEKDEKINARKGDYISLFAVSKKAKFLSSQGLKYPLDGITIKRNKPIGVSNFALCDNIYISIKKGKVLIIKSSE